MIRAAHADDLSPLYAMWVEKMILWEQSNLHIRLLPDSRAAWLDAYRAFLNDPQRSVWVAHSDENGELIGYIAGRLMDNSPGLAPRLVGMIDALVMDAHGYHRGVGRALFTALSDWFRTMSVSEAGIAVGRTVAVEQAFWRSLGAKDEMDILWINLSSD